MNLDFSFDKEKGKHYIYLPVGKMRARRRSIGRQPVFLWKKGNMQIEAVGRQQES
jgi:hypothetical protein